MKTYKQLINEVKRVRKSKEAWDNGVRTARWAGLPDTDTRNLHHNAGHRTARDMGSGLPADDGGDGSMGSGLGQAALLFTRKQRVEATKKIAERAAKGKQDAIAANANKRLSDQRERTTPQ